MKFKFSSISILYVSLFMIVATGFSSCKEGESYSDLLNDEREAVNWYLAQHRVVPYIPEDSVFEVGPDAPFYRMDSDGSVYMRVLDPGDMENRPVSGQTVYIRFTRQNIKYLQQGITGVSDSNSDDMTTATVSLIYGNSVLPSTTRYGEGLQVPLDFLGYNCEVDLIVKSVLGASGDISKCIPYIYTKTKYFKAEY